MTTLLEAEELKKLTPLQRELHAWPSNGEIESIFGNEITKCAWYSTGLVQMMGNSSISGNDIETVIFQVGKTWHYLIYSFMRIHLPRISIKKEFEGRVRIAWPRNIGTNIIVDASFTEDNLKFHGFDNVWCDIYYQFLQDPGFRKRHSKSIGNIPELVDWHEVLESKVLNVDQPWFYSYGTSQAYPIHEKGASCRAEHIYKLRTKLSDLIRVQKKDTDEGDWVNVTQNFGMYIDGLERIPTPELWGRFGVSTKEELEHRKAGCNTNSRYLYVRDVIKATAKNTKPANKISDVQLTCEHPCLALFWVAENTKATSMHNFSNYTNNPFDLHNGEDAIVTNTLVYAGGQKFSSAPSDLFSDAEPRYHMKSAPNEEGYHAWSISYYCLNNNPDVGISPSAHNASLNCGMTPTVKDDLEPIEESLHNKEGFLLHARMLVLKRVAIKENPQGIEFTLE